MASKTIEFIKARDRQLSLPLSKDSPHLRSCQVKRALQSWTPIRWNFELLRKYTFPQKSGKTQISRLISRLFLIITTSNTQYHNNITFLSPLPPFSRFLSVLRAMIVLTPHLPFLLPSNRKQRLTRSPDGTASSACSLAEGKNEGVNLLDYYAKVKILQFLFSVLTFKSWLIHSENVNTLIFNVRNINTLILFIYNLVSPKWLRATIENT